MALANFIDRIGTAASQLLQNFNLKEFCAHLDAMPVGVTFDNAAVASAEGCATLEMAVRLLARLYPVLVISALDELAGAKATELADLARSINPDIEVRSDSLAAKYIIAVGETRPVTPATVIFAGSNGWRALVSANKPVGSGTSKNALAAGAAACFAAANVFRGIFGAQLAHGELDDEIDLSLWDFDRSGPAGPSFDDVNLDEFHLAGAGAIGHGVLWGLSRTTGIKGICHIIDHETIDLGNLQRYILALQSDDKAIKVELAEKVLRSAGIKPKPFKGTWAQFAAQHPSRQFSVVAVAVDSSKDRIGIQASLPKLIINGWTQDIDLGISKHIFDSSGPCLACLYMPDGQKLNQDQLISAELRLPEFQHEIRSLLQTDAGVSEEFLSRVAEKFGISPAEFKPFVGKSLQEFYQKAICGGLVMKLTDGNAAPRAVVPMAFQSALAGILIAAELIKCAMEQSVETRYLTRVNLLRPLATILKDPRAKDDTKGCLCADADFIGAYRSKYQTLT